MERVKTGGGSEVKLQNQVKALSNKVKGGSSLLCAELEKFGKKPDKRSATSVDIKTWNLIYALGEVKELVALKVPSIKRNIPAVKKDKPRIAEDRLWWWRADNVEKALWKAMKAHHYKCFRELMVIIKRYGAAQVTFTHDENLKPVSCNLLFERKK